MTQKEIRGIMESAAKMSNAIKAADEQLQGALSDSDRAFYQIHKETLKATLLGLRGIAYNQLRLYIEPDCKTATYHNKTYVV